MPKISIALQKSNPWRLLAVPLVVAWTLGPTPAEGQSGAGFMLGAALGANLDTRQLFVAPSGRIYLPSLPVSFSPEAELYLNGSGLRWQVGLHAIYDFQPPNRPFRPYAGGGVAVVHTPDPTLSEPDNGTTSIAMNAVGGVLFLPGPLHPFAQVRLTIGETNTIGLSGGLVLRLTTRAEP